MKWPSLGEFGWPPGNIPRHYIVKKKGLTTVLSEAAESRICEEEVLFNAIGYSVFETLRASNIIFEGWRDKELFRVGVNAIKRKNKQIHGTLSTFGLTHAEGTKDIRNVAGFLEIAGRKLLVLSDCDQVALEAKKRYEAQHGYGQWLTYKDLLPAVPTETGEDFVTASAFIAATKMLAKSDPAIPLLAESDFLTLKFKLPSIRKKLSDAGIGSADAQKRIVDKIKEYVFTHLRADQLEDVYFDYLEAVAQTTSNTAAKT